MAEELEIKLSLEAGVIVQALDWLLAQPEAEKGSQKPLVNCYYDTPTAGLNHQQAALRVRQAGDRYIQTLKTRGEFVDGAHRRDEWEWPVPGPELSLALLAETPLGEQIDTAQLAPVFETNFTRQVVMLDDGKAVIECAVDNGVIIAGGQEKPLHEVEFELVSGDASRLLVWAEKLARQCPVFLNLVSKAEQGYHLAGLHPGMTDEEAGGHDSAKDDIDRFLQKLSRAWLEQRNVSFNGLDMPKLEAGAEACGQGQAFRSVIKELSAGQPLQTVLNRPELGQCQLGLLSNRVRELSGA